MKNKVYCFYHSVDADGWCSGAVFYHLIEVDPKDEIVMYPINYGDDFPELNKDEIKKIFFCDFSPTPSQCDYIDTLQCEVIIIDHHKSNYEKITDRDYEFFTSDSKPAACQLVLDYINKTSKRNYNLDPIPIVSRISDYDTYTFKFPDTYNIHLSLQSKQWKTDVKSHEWHELITASDTDHEGLLGEYDSLLYKMAEEGSIIKDYKEETAKNYIGMYGFKFVWEGYKCYVVNHGLAGTDFFSSIDVNEYDILVGFAFTGEKYRFSLRTVRDDIDLSEIAKRFGGGGHKKASGFLISSEELVEKIFKKN